MLIAATSYIAYDVVDTKLNSSSSDDDNENADENEKRKKDPDRTEPANLEEKLVLEEAKAGAGENTGMTIKDPKYNNGEWQKMEHIKRNKDGKAEVDIHYWKNKNTGESHGFKFKNQPKISEYL